MIENMPITNKVTLRLRFQTLSMVSLFTVSIGTSAGAVSPKSSIIYDFGGDAKGNAPEAGLVQDKNDIFYGVTSGLLSTRPRSLGTIFSLTPPARYRDPWTEKIIYEFKGGADGMYPTAALLLGPVGTLYGTITTKQIGNGGSLGVIYMLSPPANGGTSWTKTVIASEGADRLSSLVSDPSGNLYGAFYDAGISGNNCLCGGVYMLAPPAVAGGQWSATQIYGFQGGADGSGPAASLLYSNGVLFGTTSAGGTANAGTVFELVPPVDGQSTWTETTLYSFQSGTDGAAPMAPVIAKSTGILLGTTSQGGAGGAGTVFKLTPPADGASSWSEETIFAFNYSDGDVPMAGLTAGPGGSVYGTTQFSGNPNAGVAFRLDPPLAGNGSWSEVILHDFSGVPDGEDVLSNVFIGNNGLLYGTTVGGGVVSPGCSHGCGTIFQIKP